MADLAGLSRSGQVKGAGDDKALFLKVFAGEVLTAFERMTVMMSRHQVRTITSGKSASFPVMGRTAAGYLKPGKSLDDQRDGMQHNEVVVPIDGLLTADAIIADIDDAMNYYDVRTEYSRQLGEALAIAADCAVINETANLCAGADASKKENIPTVEAGTNSKLKVLGTGKAVEIVTGADTAATKEYGQKILDGLINARSIMTKNYVPASERYFVCNPDAYSALIMALMPNAANYQILFNPETGKLMNVAGFEIIETPHFINAGVGAAAAPGGVAHALASSLSTAKLQGVAFHRSAVATVKLKDLAMERARRAEYQADMLIAKYAMGHLGLRPEAAVVFVKQAQA